MRQQKFIFRIIVILCFLTCFASKGKADEQTKDSINTNLLDEYKKKLVEIELQRQTDSIIKGSLETQLRSLKTTDNLKKEQLVQQLQDIKEKEQLRILHKKQQIESLRSSATGYPVFGIFKDTLFSVYAKSGALSARERADYITKKINDLYNNDFLKVDSISIVEDENTVDIVYGDMIITSISESDALWQNQSRLQLAKKYENIIKANLQNAIEESQVSKVVTRIALVFTILLIVIFLFWVVRKLTSKLLLLVKLKRSSWFRDFKYKDYQYLSSDQAFRIFLFLFKPLRLILYATILYASFTILFSIFPFTRNWANELLSLTWEPLKSLLLSAWNYFPKLITILVIYFVIKYINRFIHYIFKEIEDEKLKINGFYPDWAMPTYGVIRFLLYAFMIVLIFPHLPGSDSTVFKGISVFIGVLLSFGSSSAIANIIAGLVITYMRPFKVGDRIKIGDILGDVEEKTLLVTRIKTLKNEVVTTPNSSLLTGNVINYSKETENEGVILHTNVTIGYDVPWKIMHEALLEAANRTEFAEKLPHPFVLQTSLDDFYVSYQINIFVKQVKYQAVIYSNLHKNIQDVCNERDIEIMSPHYRAQRDGNKTTIPENYFKDDYEAPAFQVKLDNKD